MSTRDKLLARLKAAKGEWVSGEGLSGELSVSRAAISKQVARLKAEGYGISAAPRKGYRLEEITDRLLPGEILARLGEGRFGRGEIHYFDTVDSTNTRAKALAAAGAAEGTLVLAETQTEGRGRKKRPWFSPDGCGIYLSLILRPEVAPADAPRFTLMAAVAVAEAVRAYAGLPVTIKWPNDILAGGRKLSGILTEMSMEMDAVDHIVVGLGLNVNTEREAFPAEVSGIATSIRAETGERVDRAGLLAEILARFEVCYALMESEGFQPVLKRWKALSDIIGKRVAVEMIGKRIEGRVKDVDENGILIVEDEEGRIAPIISGDVTLL